jgi:hypothetical protein
MNSRIVFSLPESTKDKFIACLEYRHADRNDFLEECVSRYVDETILIYENDPASLQ